MKFDQELMHYASKYYDPAKAHEYYMRNRQLKGRRSVSKLNRSQKKKWAYTKDQVTKEKKATIVSARETRQATIERYRAAATATRTRISETLKRLKEIITAKSVSDREKIAEDKQAKIDRVAEVPTGLSKEERAKWMEVRKQQISSIRDSSNSKSKGVTADAKEERSATSEAASEARTVVRDQLKSAVTSTREAYKTRYEEIKSRYENVYQKEYDNVRKSRQ